jgi:REP element-mobilizing transposase RayT
MVRGIERRAIFLDDADREAFLGRLSRLVPELGFRCFAWALMPNHVHLVVRSGAVRISRLMARLGTGYARYFNERHDRVGHLFQNRFRSRPVVDDTDLTGLVLYVVRNPLAAGLVADAGELERFAWCGLGALLGRRAPRPFEAVAETLGLFDPDPDRARTNLRARLGGPPSEPIPLPPEPRARPVPPRPLPSGFGALLREVCSRFGLTEEQVHSNGRTRMLAAARSEVALRAASELGLSGAEVARRLGVTKSTVSVMLRARRPPPGTS